MTGLEKAISISMIQDDDAQGMTGILGRVTASQDSDRIKSLTALINSFNMAIQLQAGRRMWTPSDTRAFSIAMVAMDSIGADKSESDDIEDAIGSYVGKTQRRVDE